jgi:hypothetical protein
VSAGEKTMKVLLTGRSGSRPHRSQRRYLSKIYAVK